MHLYMYSSCTLIKTKWSWCELDGILSRPLQNKATKLCNCAGRRWQILKRQLTYGKPGAYRDIAVPVPGVSWSSEHHQQQITKPSTNIVSLSCQHTRQCEIYASISSSGKWSPFKVISALHWVLTGYTRRSARFKHHGSPVIQAGILQWVTESKPAAHSSLTGPGSWHLPPMMCVCVYNLTLTSSKATYISSNTWSSAARSDCGTSCYRCTTLTVLGLNPWCLWHFETSVLK